jgi:hypothetical protein
VYLGGHGGDIFHGNDGNGHGHISIVTLTGSTATTAMITSMAATTTA